MTSLCSNVFFDARCLAKAKEIQGLETLEHKDDFLEPLVSQNKGEYTIQSSNCLFHRRA